MDDTLDLLGPDPTTESYERRPICELHDLRKALREGRQPSILPADDETQDEPRETPKRAALPQPTPMTEVVLLGAAVAANGMVLSAAGVMVALAVLLASAL
jgi:hypothetical protein